MEKTILKDRIILIDADHADAVAADLRSNFKRMLGREIPAADMASWLVCCALDAGWKTEQGEVQVVFVHSAACRKLSHFLPANLEKEVDGQAFRDEKLGEFLLSAVAEEDINDFSFRSCRIHLTELKPKGMGVWAAKRIQVRMEGEYSDVETIYHRYFIQFLSTGG